MRPSALPLTAVAALLMPSVAYVRTAQAASFEKWDQAAFDKAQAEGRPVLLYIEASWCPTCAKQTPTLSSLMDDKTFRDMAVFRVNFDTQKDVVRGFGATMQSTLIVFHGKTETGRAVGETKPEAIRALLATALA